MTPLTRKTPLKAKVWMRAARRVKRSEYGVAVIVLEGGREVCTQSATGRDEYKYRLQQMAERQNNRCAICGQTFEGWMGPPTFDHQRGRTAGNKDERIVVDGKWQNAALHGKCNRIKGSSKFEWINGEYTLVMKGEKR